MNNPVSQVFRHVVLRSVSVITQSSVFLYWSGQPNTVSCLLFHSCLCFSLHSLFGTSLVVLIWRHLYLSLPPWNSRNCLEKQIKQRHQSWLNVMAAVLCVTCGLPHHLEREDVLNQEGCEDGGVVVVKSWLQLLLCYKAVRETSGQKHCLSPKLPNRVIVRIR